MKWLSNKLNYVKLKSFLIAKKKESINYELTLSLTMWIHSVFHIFLLKSAHSDTSLQNKSSEINSES